MATQNDEEASSPISQVATNGNVIFIVGSKKKRIQASSAVLENASKYFRNMFGPHFQEGQDLHGGSVKEIAMPEDDPIAMELIFKIIHLRNDSLPNALEPHQALEFALTADKFDCVVAVQSVAKLWLGAKNIKGVEGLKDHAYLMGAAYILDIGAVFSDITLSMLLNFKDRYTSLVEEDIGLDMSLLWRVSCKSLAMSFL